MIEIKLLGSPHILRDGREVKVENRKILALLAYLGLERRQRRDFLAGLLWPEYDQTRATSNLRSALWGLKKAIGEQSVLTTRQSLELAQDQLDRIDVVQFRRQLAAWASHSHPPEEPCATCQPALLAAVELYRGEFLAGFSLDDSSRFEEWQFFEAERLRRDYAQALKWLVLSNTAQATFAAALDYAWRWLAL
ncbi:MAG TPA: hypothetical protein VD886_05560, partial [Herpetosiphonaceae bacterium]|nr:hypothetical protein [Herpetosiphonaceae bacterium]